MSNEWKHAEHTVKFLESNQKFVVSGKLFDSDMPYDSMKEAKAEIDRRVMLHAKSSESKLNFEVLVPGGTVAKVKGIHARLGNLLFTDGPLSKKASESYGGIGEVYPNVEWIRALLISKAEAMAELQRMDKALRPYAINVNYSYGSRSPEQFVGAVEKLKAEFAEKLDKARKADVSKVLA